MAVGYRSQNEEPLRRKLVSRLFHFLCRVLFNIKLKEISTVSMWKRSVIESIEITSAEDSAMLLPEIISKAINQKCFFAEVPIHWHTRKGGKAKGASLKEFKTLIEMLRFWFSLQTTGINKHRDE